MELEDFVCKTLLQILSGIRKAQEECPVSRGVVCPGTYMKNPAAGQRYFGDYPVHEVEFDVAVTASEGSGNKLGAKILVFGISIGGQKTSELGQTQASRIKFSVPVRLPWLNLEDEKRRVEVLGKEN